MLVPGPNAGVSRKGVKEGRWEDSALNWLSSNEWKLSKKLYDRKETAVKNNVKQVYFHLSTAGAPKKEAVERRQQTSISGIIILELRCS
ncbi:hypothetical protein Y032_0071g571 [Ancylostoma ceylanicum]|uniref:Uncharacterized protein n=1 Tax=Ancylostoma ceylanicum TaxID=53326 RepID=A0A016TW56_9BILA|nr:hypothetical protein Y032_0071g571 [Ancylostoma ceylanicum]